jgi:SAICAR synthetase
MLSTSTCKVFIAVSTEEATASAELVAKELAVKYDVLDVTIRSAEAPADRLLFAGDNNDRDETACSALWVFYSGGTASASSFPAADAGAAVLRGESPHPVLVVPSASEQPPNEIAWTIARWCGLGCPVASRRVHQAARERRQARLVDDAQLQTRSPKYRQAMAIVYDRNLQITGENIKLETKKGKVRDRIDVNDTTIALVTTDRQSGFDRQLALVPFKGAVLNLTSAFWFEQTKGIIKNHIVAVPHPYVTIARKCQPFPIEFVVRYVTDVRQE